VLNSLEVNQDLVKANRRVPGRSGALESCFGWHHKIFPLPILCGMYCSNGRSGKNIISRNNVGDDGGGGCLNTGWMRK